MIEARRGGADGEDALGRRLAGRAARGGEGVEPLQEGLLDAGEGVCAGRRAAR